MAVLGRTGTVLGVTAFGLLVACSSGEATRPTPEPETGGATGSGGTTPRPVTGGASATGGSPGTGGSGGRAAADASSPGTGGGGGRPTDGGSTTGPEVSTPPGPVDYGGVGQQPLIPLAYTAEPVPPIVTMD